jgi:meso-butanediol dehydrogenase/(S,S)-butanediol dehydrogenase/diacetyl reductase
MVKKNFFDGKVVLITGSTRGIGLAIAKAFSNEGALIGLNGRDERVVKEAMKDVPNSISAAGDVSKVSGCKKAVQSVLGQFGRLDILINNAGIFEKHSIEDTTEEIWDSVMNANIKSVQFCTKEAIPALRKVKGSIVNIASESGLNGYPYTTAYCASKGAVVNLTRAMAMELAPDVRVNALCPGVVETDMTRAGFAINGDEEEGIRRQHEAYPLQRIGTLEEAAAATLFLASNDAGFINGAALPMEGGATAGKW